ncbi:hypothetical protein EH151_04380 [Elizabethkingia anophelis]|nr:hypothetical protein [Elizabethkingia anophelis]MYZ59126.1 hypothetical protein [Elizabethkingia anophelis]
MMKEKNTTIEKKEYIPPVIEVEIIEMEYGIAAGSGTTKPGNGGVTEEWGTDEDDGTSVDW